MIRVALFVFIRTNVHQVSKKDSYNVSKQGKTHIHRFTVTSFNLITNQEKIRWLLGTLVQSLIVFSCVYWIDRLLCNTALLCMATLRQTHHDALSWGRGHLFVWPGWARVNVDKETNHFDTLRPPCKERKRRSVTPYCCCCCWLLCHARRPVVSSLVAVLSCLVSSTHRSICHTSRKAEEEEREPREHDGWDCYCNWDVLVQKKRLFGCPVTHRIIPG